MANFYGKFPVTGGSSGTGVDSLNTLTGDLILAAGTGIDVTDNGTDTITVTMETPVAVTNGGTGTTTQFTSGSVVFADGSGVYTQDNSNLFWDDTNNRLGVGTSSPTSRLTVGGSISGAPSSTVGSFVNLNTATFTDSSTAGSGTAAAFVANTVGPFTLAATNASVTTTTAIGTMFRGPIVAGTNQTITNSYAVYNQAGALTNTTNGYGFRFDAPTGATNNYAGFFNGGNVGFGTSAPTAAIHVSNSGASGTTTSTTASSLNVTTGTFTDSNTAASGTSTGYNGSIFLQPTLAATNASVTSSNVANLHVRGPVIAGTNQSITSSYGLWVSGGGSVSSGVTSSYAARLDPTSGATNNYGLYVSSGNSGFGTSSPVGLVHISNSPTLTTLPSGTTGAQKLLVTNGAVTDSSTAASGTNSAFNFNNFYLGTLAATNASVTTTNLSNILVSHPNSSTNMTVTNAHGIRIPTTALTTVTNSYGLSVAAATGATNNYAAQFTGGNVGIGIAAPTALLHQDGGNATASYHKFTAGTTTGTTATDGFSVGISSAGVAELRQYESQSMQFYTANTKFGECNSSGNWSFGATMASGTNAAAVHAFSAASSATGLTMALESTNTNGYSGALAFRVNPSGGGGPYSAATINGVNSNNAGATDGGKLEFYTADQAGSHTLNKRMTIDQAGFVGIGVASPAQKLQVNLSSSTAFSAGGLAGSSDQFYLVNEDGTTSAYSGMALAVGSSQTAVGRFDYVRTGSQAGDFVFSHRSTGEVMRIMNSGNVGIGTNAPASTLQVTGTQQGSVTAVSADTTLGAHYIVTVDDSAATRTMTLPAASSTIIGRVYRIKKMSASNTTVIARAGADTIDGATSVTLTAQYQTVDIICLTATTWGVF